MGLFHASFYGAPNLNRLFDPKTATKTCNKTDADSFSIYFIIIPYLFSQVVSYSQKFGGKCSFPNLANNTTS